MYWFLVYIYKSHPQLTIFSGTISMECILNHLYTGVACIIRDKSLAPLTLYIYIYNPRGRKINFWFPDTRWHIYIYACWLASMKYFMSNLFYKYNSFLWESHTIHNRSNNHKMYNQFTSKHWKYRCARFKRGNIR